MKTSLFILSYLALMAIFIGIIWLVNRAGYHAGFDKGVHTKGTWTKEVRTHTDTIYHFKPE